MSEDVLWYNLNSVVPNVNNYPEFEACLNDMRTKRQDIKKVSSFMSRHYTSCRVPLLIEVINKYGIIEPERVV